MAAHLDTEVSALGAPTGCWAVSLVWADALTIKVREDGRVVNVHALIVTGFNAGGHREILG
jgi:putative transposase